MLSSVNIFIIYFYLYLIILIINKLLYSSEKEVSFISKNLSIKYFIPISLFFFDTLVFLGFDFIFFYFYFFNKNTFLN